jgi:hypothetical protein
MPSLWVRIALIISSFAPILLVWDLLIWVDERQFSNRLFVILVCFILFVILPPLILRASRKRLGNICIKLESISITGNSGDSFMGSYLLPFLANAITDSWYYLMLVIMGIFAVILWMNSTYAFNPTLALFGYRFYEVTNSDHVKFILLSKRILRTTQAVNSIYEVTDFLILDGEG